MSYTTTRLALRTTKTSDCFQRLGCSLFICSFAGSRSDRMEYCLSWKRYPCFYFSVAIFTPFNLIPFFYKLQTYPVPRHLRFHKGVSSDTMVSRKPKPLPHPKDDSSSYNATPLTRQRCNSDRSVPALLLHMPSPLFCPEQDMTQILPCQVIQKSSERARVWSK